MDIVILAHQVSAFTSSAINKASVAIGYGKTCQPQDNTCKNMPAGSAVCEEAHPDAPILARKVLEDKTNNSVPDILEPVLDIPATIKPVPPCKNAKESNAQTLSKGAMKKFYRTKAQEEVRKHHREVRKKIIQGQARRKSWNPKTMLENQWKKLSKEEKAEVIANVKNLAFQSSVKAQEWLQWNLPKLTYKAFCLAVSVDMPETTLDAFRILDMERDLDKFWLDT